MLLVFTLMVGPAAAAQNFSRRLAVGVALSAGLALAEAWGGLTLAFYSDWPTSFWITALSGLVYFASLAARRLAREGGRRSCSESVLDEAAIGATHSLLPRRRALLRRPAVAARGSTRRAKRARWRSRRAGGCDELLARVLAGRGVGLDEVARHLDPTLRALMPDPFALADMEKATARLADAVRRAERIAIFADYDVDGAASAALLSEYLQACGCETIVHIPDRVTEGYGPNREAMAAFAARGASLVVTVDCGAVSHEPIAEAREARPRRRRLRPSPGARAAA